MPKISIVTPCFEAEKFISETMQSVREQTFADWEYIVVDDGSKDDSAARVREIAALDHRMSLVVQENRGVAAARTAGYENCHPSSDYLVFLDADDILAPTFLAHMSQYLDDNPDVGLAYCEQIDIDDTGQVVGEPALKRRFVSDGLRIRTLDPTSPPTPLDALVSRFEAIPSTCMFRRSIFEGVIGWREAGVTEDKDIGIQMALAAPVHFVAEHLMSYRHHDDQRHFDRFYASMEELHRRWWNDDSLSPHHRSAVRQALCFDRRVAGYLSREHARDLVQRSEHKEAARVALRSVKQSLEWLGLEIRRKAPTV